MVKTVAENTVQVILLYRCSPELSELRILKLSFFFFFG